MIATTNDFVHIGMGTIIQKARVILITKPKSTTARRYIELAKKSGKYLDATQGKRFRSIVVMDDSTVIMCTIHAMTLMKRMNRIGMADEDIQAADQLEAEEADDIETEDDDE